MLLTLSLVMLLCASGSCTILTFWIDIYTSLGTLWSATETETETNNRTPPTTIIMSCLSITKTFVLASLTNNNNNPKIKTTKNKHLQLHQQNKPQQKQQPSITQIERAIGADTMFRDTDPRELEQINRLVNGLVTNSTGDIEGAIQQKIRETGESIANVTERSFRSSGKKILLFMLQWILPIWILSLIVAAGVIKLPFSTPLLDDLIL